MSKYVIDTEMMTIINEILKRGNSVEIKRERDQIVIVEIKRQVKIKAIGEIE